MKKEFLFFTIIAVAILMLAGCSSNSAKLESDVPTQTTATETTSNVAEEEKQTESSAKAEPKKQELEQQTTEKIAEETSPPVEPKAEEKQAAPPVKEEPKKQEQQEAEATQKDPAPVEEDKPETKEQGPAPQESPEQSATVATESGSSYDNYLGDTRGAIVEQLFNAICSVSEITDVSRVHKDDIGVNIIMNSPDERYFSVSIAKDCSVVYCDLYSGTLVGTTIDSATFTISDQPSAIEWVVDHI